MVLKVTVLIRQLDGLSKFDWHVLSPFFLAIMLLHKVKVTKVASSNTSNLEAHAGFYRLLMKGIFDP